MEQIHDTNLLDFLAEGFLQQGASVTYKNFSGTPALRVTAENTKPRIYITAEEEVSKMTFLRQLITDDILVPVLRSEEEMRLKAALAKAGVTNIIVYRLSLHERYAWYSREFINKRTNGSASVEGIPVCRGTGC